MSSFLRRDDWVTDALGNAISGASVYVCSQPATTNTIPPSPEVQLYADSAGVTPITQPVITDGYGHAFYYVAPGTYTVVYYSPQIQQLNLLDQAIVSTGTSNWSNDSSNAGTITGSVDGTNTVFVLSGTPLPAASLFFMVNGVFQQGFTLSGATVTLPVAPHASNVLNAIYSTS